MFEKIPRLEGSLCSVLFCNSVTCILTGHNELEFAFRILISLKTFISCEEKNYIQLKLCRWINVGWVMLLNCISHVHSVLYNNLTSVLHWEVLFKFLIKIFQEWNGSYLLLWFLGQLACFVNWAHHVGVCIVTGHVELWFAFDILISLETFINC